MRTTDETEIKKARLLGWVILGLPLLFFIPLLALALVVRCAFGYFPSYNNPDPKQLGMGVFIEVFIYFSLTVSMASLILSIVSVPFVSLGLTKKAAFIRVILVLAMSGFNIWFLRGDQLGLLEWLAD